MYIAPQDPTRATNPLDACLARRLISDEAHSAAVYFASLRKLVFGKPIPPAIDLTAVSVYTVPEEMDRGEAEGRYKDACAAIKGYSRQAFDAVENLIVHERWPVWLFEGRGNRIGSQRQFMLGVAALLGWYRGMRRKVA